MQAYALVFAGANKPPTVTTGAWSLAGALDRSLQSVEADRRPGHRMTRAAARIVRYTVPAGRVRPVGDVRHHHPIHRQSVV